VQSQGKSAGGVSPLIIQAMEERVLSKQSWNIGASGSSPLTIHTSKENTIVQSQGKSTSGLSPLIIQVTAERVLLYSHETWVVGAQVL